MSQAGGATLITCLVLNVLASTILTYETCCQLFLILDKSPFKTLSHLAVHQKVYRARRRELHAPTCPFNLWILTFLINNRIQGTLNVKDLLRSKLGQLFTAPDIPNTNIAILASDCKLIRRLIPCTRKTSVGRSF
jgi:hypothetical protein